MKKLSHILLLLTLTLLAGCREEAYDEAFTMDSTVRLEVKGNAIFTYNPLLCQLYFNRSTGTFRAGSDSMSDYFSLTLPSIPTSESIIINGNIRWTIGANVFDKKNVTLKVVKLEGDRIWLRATRENIGLVVRMLDQ